MLHIVCKESRADIIKRKNKTIRQNKVKIKPVYCPATDISYPSIQDVAISLRLDSGAISRCLSGKQNSTKGYTFEKVEK